MLTFSIVMLSSLVNNEQTNKHTKDEKEKSKWPFIFQFFDAGLNFIHNTKSKAKISLFVHFVSITDPWSYNKITLQHSSIFTLFLPCITVFLLLGAVPLNDLEENFIFICIKLCFFQTFLNSTTTPLFV
jgi:hypothetical protein